MNIVAAFFRFEIQLIPTIQSFEIIVCYVAISEVIQNVYDVSSCCLNTFVSSIVTYCMLCSAFESKKYGVL